MHYAIVKFDGTHEVVEYEPPLDIQVIQKALAAPKEEGHAYFEVIGGPNVSIFLNENGKYLSLPPNVAVTLFARANQMIWPSDIVVGDCVVMGQPDNNGRQTDLNDEILADILSYYPKRVNG
jgi:hypothetical protein